MPSIISKYHLMSLYVTLFHFMSLYVTLSHFISLYVTLRHFMFFYATLSHFLSLYVTLCCLCHFMSFMSLHFRAKTSRDDILNDIEYSLYFCDLSNPFGRDKHTIKIVVRGTI